MDHALNLLLARQEREKEAMFKERMHGQKSTFAMASKEDEEFEKRFERA